MSMICRALRSAAAGARPASAHASALRLASSSVPRRSYATEMTVRDALTAAMDEEMAADEKVFVMGE
eukprot:tig00001604_g9403.t1